mmetsp:Transcript_869/g.793  ORF Transcript_869/g.793 Transcript_869/m.793 type:complete len:80 (+) Transcript_869:442-681(+)|eukprot:CAMPEP_0114581034 /NCGR_PEP_ID=MMETSP0125-20121206/5186_1 /TAXON_ID=485358 ORGANISM="Aristerostoma sp., Strain ATCC 50986" /NCGR_SAMPLE_ID=MMETSP0125 /ASSEMBLY_ACC=CAM_ASM_000245 /LENGTH=79 /DNA_ID=CAMNT_0001772925 /DNA_START=357 /DNA_END=596 /DNA_ORIENTATION=-
MKTETYSRANSNEPPTREDSLFAQTLVDDDQGPPGFDGPTLADAADDDLVDEPPAFRLRLLYDERLGKVLYDKPDIEMV